MFSISFVCLLCLHVAEGADSASINIFMTAVSWIWCLSVFLKTSIILRQFFCLILPALSFQF